MTKAHSDLLDAKAAYRYLCATMKRPAANEAERDDAMIAIRVVADAFFTAVDAYVAEEMAKKSEADARIAP